MDIVTKISSLTKDSGAIRDLRDLLQMVVFQMPAFEKMFTTITNARNGEKVGWTGQLENVGWAQAKTCNPTYKNLAQDFAEKTWDMGRWAVPGKWCADDFENSIAEYALKHGTAVADMTGTDIMDIVIYPALQEAMLKMYNRVVWFSDKAAKSHTSSGHLTSTIEPTLFTMTDGLWKRLFAVGAAKTDQVTKITANAKASLAEQKSDLYTEGNAVKIFEDILMNADSRIAGLTGAAIFCTDSLAKALSRDMMKIYKQSLPWEKIESGVEGVEIEGLRQTEFEGVPVIGVGMWDRMILEFENSGAKLNLPHRAYYGSPTQLLVGTPADAMISDIDIDYDKFERVVKCYAEGKIGTLLGQDDLFHLAY